MKTWKITYRFNNQFGWQIGYKLLQANSREDAIKKADIWEKLILKVEIV